MEKRRDEPSDQFPVGMRVLAVDDDPICLRLLETLLRKCQYHVTTTSQAITALEMLRENKNYFDLVISDVHMPDMDGFKLLELVGLEMDLPVIMLSANGDTRLVMQGITHGACDYLLKPVRIEELKTIWQHVVRRRHLDSRDQNSCNIKDKSSVEGNGVGSANSNPDAKLGKKRKDQNGDDDDEQDENEHENEDPSSQKKPRVVWSVELHRKFVAAVNQLGLDKAVPKKILELMNVEKLTRENVASHLQKYRLYLKRISSVANQQANMVAALGGPDSPYLRMDPVNFSDFSGSAQLQNNALRPISPAGVHGKLNSPARLGLHVLSPSGMVQLGHCQILRSSVNESIKYQPGLLPVDQPGTILQGMPTSLEFNRFQHKKGVIGGEELHPSNNNSGTFPISRNFSDSSSSSSSLASLPNGSLTMLGHVEDRQSHKAFQINSDSPHHLLDHYRWHIPVPQQTAATNLSISDLRLETQNQAGLMSENMMQNKLDICNHADFLSDSGNPSMTTQAAYPCLRVEDPKCTSMVLHGNTGLGLTGQPGFDSLVTEQGRPYSDYMGNELGSLEDVVTAMFKRV